MIRTTPTHCIVTKLGREKPNYYFGQFFGFLERETKNRRLEKTWRGASPKSFPKSLGKVFFLPRQHYGDLPPQTHPNESQSSVHAFINLLIRLNYVV